MRNTKAFTFLVALLTLCGGVYGATVAPLNLCGLYAHDSEPFLVAHFGPGGVIQVNVDTNEAQRLHDFVPTNFTKVALKTSQESEIYTDLLAEWPSHFSSDQKLLYIAQYISETMNSAGVDPVLNMVIAPFSELEKYTGQPRIIYHAGLTCRGINHHKCALGRYSLTFLNKREVSFVYTKQSKATERFSAVPVTHPKSRMARFCAKLCTCWPCAKK